MTEKSEDQEAAEDPKGEKPDPEKVSRKNRKSLGKTFGREGIEVAK